MILRQLFCLVLVFGFAVPGLAQNNVDDIDKRFTADVLKRELFAKTVEERGFCDYVIQKRDDGTIPPRIIYSVYQKTMAKDRNVRFTYFKTALETVCKREGIVLYSTPVRATSSFPSFTLPSFRGLFQRN